MCGTFFFNTMHDENVCFERFRFLCFFNVGLARADKTETVRFWTVRDRRSVQTAGPSGFWTVRTVRTVLRPLSWWPARVVQTAKMCPVLTTLFLVPIKHKIIYIFLMKTDCLGPSGRFCNPTWLKQDHKLRSYGPGPSMNGPVCKKTGTVRVFMNEPWIWGN